MSPSIKKSQESRRYAHFNGFIETACEICRECYRNLTVCDLSLCHYCGTLLNTKNYIPKTDTYEDIIEEEEDND